MTLTGISNRGLAVIALLVAVLWGCILAERAMVSRARRETMLLLRPRNPVRVNYPEKKRLLYPAPVRSLAG